MHFTATDPACLVEVKSLTAAIVHCQVNLDTQEAIKRHPYSSVDRGAESVAGYRHCRSHFVGLGRLPPTGMQDG